MMEGPSPLERGGRLGRWLCIMLFLRLVSFLVSRLRPNEAWISDWCNSLVALAFVLHLSWKLLSQHVLPFRVQDYSVSGIWVACHDAARDALGQCVVNRREIGLWCLERMTGCFRTVLVRIQTSIRGRTTSGENSATNESELELNRSLLDGNVQPIQSLQTSDSLLPVPPTLTVMERLGDTNEEEEVCKQQVSPKLQDKKKW